MNNTLAKEFENVIENSKDYVPEIDGVVWKVVDGVAAESCASLCEDIAIEFGEWLRINDYQTASKEKWIGLNLTYYTTKELFALFIEQRKKS